MAMPLKSIRAWLGVGASEQDEFAPLRQTLDALDHLEPDRARYLAAFAYVLGRVAHADQHVSTEETRAMEALVEEHGQLSRDQAMVVVQLAKASNLLFGGTANYLVARELSNTATYDQKLALMRCLFACQQRMKQSPPPRKVRFTESRRSFASITPTSSRCEWRISGICPE